jgi:hypothetical protein
MTRLERRERRRDRKAAKKALKGQGKGGLTLVALRLFRASMRNELQRRNPNVDIKAKYKKNFPGLVLDFYNTVVYPNRAKIRKDVSSFDPEFQMDLRPVSIPTPEQATEAFIRAEANEEWDSFIESAVAVASSVIRAIIQFFKSLKQDKDEGRPLGDLGTLAGDVVRVDKELGKQVREEAAESYIMRPVEQALKNPLVLGGLALFIFNYMKK